MCDTAKEVGNSKIQHGPLNNRIYLMNLDSKDMPKLISRLDKLADEHKYTKIFAKVPKEFSKIFMEHKYTSEAVVPNFFNGKTDCFFMGKYTSNERSVEVDKELNKKVIETARSKKALNVKLPSNFTIKKSKPSDSDQISKLYSQVFKSYPFPIFDSEYIRETMNDDIVYFTVRKDNEIVAISACDICKEEQNVEMTDFAVAPKYRGHNLAYYLLIEMEKEMKQRNVKIAYTIARSVSYGMNSAFAKSSYEFVGRLVQNTQIGGSIEDMNVWFKPLFN